MGRIQTNIGLITGIPIGDTVEQLMALAARPRDLLIARTDKLREEQVAVTELSALLAAVQFTVTNLGKANLYDQRTVTSSHPDVLAATITGNPPLGSYQFTPIRVVQHHQLLAAGIKVGSAPLGGGVFTFRFGDHVERSIDLDALNGGQGIVRGALRITDRSGASAEIDLTTVQTVDDVLEAINENTTIGVTATAIGDQIRLVDHTGQTVSNLKVQEVGTGTTAASLGLGGIDVADDVADGLDLLWLAEDLDLDLLNDGNGVFADRILDDIGYQLRDGTTGVIDLSPIIPGSSEVDAETTLGELLEVINAAEPGKLKIEIAPEGDRLVLTDLTEGGGSFTVRSLNDSTVLEDLGLDGSSVDGVIAGSRILGGVKTVLLSSLGGGEGFGPLGQLSLTDRSGAAAVVDLSAAETLDDVIGLINAAGVGIVARVNQARHGIELVDTTGASDSHLVVANADATNTADKLGIAVDADVTSVDSGDMHLQVVARNTRLSDLNGGAGVARDGLTIYDTNGRHAELNLRDDDIQTIGDVIRAINRLGLDAQAELNETGDGIRLRDLAHGSETLRVEEGDSTTAADLHLLGEAVEVDVGGEMTWVLDGSTTYRIELDDTDSLSDFRDKINELKAGVTATILNDGSSRPFRLALHSDRPGRAGELLVDASGVGLTFQETVRARDALLMFGETGANVLIASSSNTFDDVIAGVRLELKQPSRTLVTVTVDKTDTDLVATVKTMVENYNRFRERLAELTAYDSETDSRSVLTGDATALRLDMDLAYLLSGSLVGAGSIHSLRELGIALQDDGTLELDESALRTRCEQDPEAIRRFFAEEQFGLSAKLDGLIERLSGEENSLLAARLETLNSKIEQNEERIAHWDARLEIRRQRLYLQFYRMELAIGKLQANLSALEAFNPVPPLAFIQQQ